MNRTDRATRPLADRGHRGRARVARILARAAWTVVLALPICSATPGQADDSFRDRLTPGGEVDTTYAGLPISRIEIRTLPVFLGRDVFSWAINHTHFTTRTPVVSRELLFEVGDTYDPDLALETERILRATGLFNDVWIIPVLHASDGRPDSLVVEVTTQDRYSFYVSAGYSAGGGKDEFEFQVGENNFLGWSDLLNVGYFNTPVDTRYRLGYTKRRLTEYWQIRLRAGYQRDDVFLQDGHSLLFALERPLYAREATWAFHAFYSRRDESRFRLIGNALRLAGKNYENAADDELPASKQFRWANRFDEVNYGANYTRSWGFDNKVNASVGFRVTDREYRPMEDLDSLQLAFFKENVVPGDTDRRELLFGVEFEHIRFAIDRNLFILGTTEDVTLGWSMALKWSLSHRELGSDSTFARPRIEFGSLMRFAGRHYLQLQFAAENELASSGAIDNLVLADIRTYTRPWKESLLTVATRIILRDETDPNDLSSLGGDTGLRGYLADAFLGPDLFRFNIEWRTPPLKIWFAHFAAAAFVDAGQVGDRLWHDDLRVGAGFGLRIGMPQFTGSLAFADFAIGFNQPERQGDLAFLDHFYFGDQPPF